MSTILNTRAQSTRAGARRDPARALDIYVANTSPIRRQYVAPRSRRGQGADRPASSAFEMATTFSAPLFSEVSAALAAYFEGLHNSDAGRLAELCASLTPRHSVWHTRSCADRSRYQM